MTTKVATAPAPRPSHRSDPVGRTLATLLGSASEEAAHQAERTIRDRARLFIQACRLAGSTERGERFLAELRASLAPTLPVLTSGLIQRAQEADGAEEEAQTRWFLDQNPTTARQFRIALETEVAAKYDLILALRGVEAQ